VNATSACMESAVIELTEQRGAKYVFESVGKRKAMEMAYRVLSKPGHCVLAGN